jgi:curved DNA-binding protein CbpA
MAEIMSNAKTHYQTLGVQPDAEDVVIKAAYRALAQRYHPDKWQGDPAIATARMAEINGAYEVLSDPLKRAKYDEQIKASGEDSQFSDAQMDEEVLRDSLPEFDEEWSYASEYYPEIKPLFESLKKVNNNLAFEFKVTLVTLKAFKKAQVIHDKMRSEFLERYFGTNREVIRSAENFLRENNRAALLELNKAIRILGSSFNLEKFLKKVSASAADSRKQAPAPIKTNLDRLADVVSDTGSVRDATYLLELLGYKVVRHGTFFTVFDVMKSGEYKKRQVSGDDLMTWVRYSVIPNEVWGGLR